MKNIIKPKNITLPFTEWWDTLSDDQVVNIRQQKMIKNLYFKNLKIRKLLSIRRNMRLVRIYRFERQRRFKK